MEKFLFSFQKGRKFTLEDAKKEKISFFLSFSLSQEQWSFGPLDYFNYLFQIVVVSVALVKEITMADGIFVSAGTRPMTNRILCFRWADPVGGLSKIRAHDYRRNEAVSFREVFLVVRGELFRPWPQAWPGVQEQKHGSSRGQIQVLEMLEIVSLEAPFDGACKSIVRPEEGRVLPLL